MIAFIIINILVFVFAFVCAFFVINKHNKAKASALFLTTISTLMGFFLSISNNYMYQFNYDMNTIIHSFDVKNNGVRFSKIIENEITSPPKFIFLLDISKSTNIKVKAKTTKDKDRIKKQIDKVNGSKHNKKDQKKKFGWDEKNKEILFSELLRIRLLGMLESLKELEYDFFEYSIISFSEKATEFTPQNHNFKNRQEEMIARLDETYEKFLDKGFCGDTTDFYELFKYINNEVFNAGKINLRTDYKSKECIFIFLSDYIHDANIDKETLENQIQNLCRKFNEANINLKLYILNYSSLLKNEGLVNIADLLKNNLSQEAYQELDIVKDSISTWYSKTTKEPISFFYSNNIFEDNLKSYLVFDNCINTKTLSIHLEKKDKSDRLEYILYNAKNAESKQLLSNRDINIEVNNEDKMCICVQGQIPEPYSTPNLVIEDSSTGVLYYIPIVFYKNFPKTGWLLLSAILGILLVWGFWIIKMTFILCKDYIKRTDIIEIGTIEKL